MNNFNRNFLLLCAPEANVGGAKLKDILLKKMKMKF